MIGLTKRQADCLKAIEDLTVDGMSPSYAEIAERIGVTGKSTIHRLIVALEERGLIRRLPDRARALEVTSRRAPGRVASDVAAQVCRTVWERKAAGEAITRPVLFEIVREALR